MNDSDTTEAKHDLAAFIYSALAAVGFSFVPVLIDISASPGNSLTVGAGVMLGFLIFSEILRRFRRTSSDLSYTGLLQRIQDGDASRAAIWLLLVTTGLGTLSYLAFAWSTTYIDTAVSAAIFEFWPLVFIIVMRYVDKHRHAPFTPEIISLATRVLLFVGALAIVPIVFSSHAPSNTGSIGLQLFGITLALIAPICGGIQAVNLLVVDHMLYGKSSKGTGDWAVVKNLRQARKDEALTEKEIKKRQFLVEESVSAAGHVVARALFLPLAFVLAMIEQGGTRGFWSWPFLGGIAAGSLFSGPAGMFNRRSQLVSDNRIVISILYLTPVLSILWLSIYRDLAVPRLDLLLFGSIAIVAINMLINVDPEAAPAEKGTGDSGTRSHDDLDHRHDGPIVKPVNDRLGFKALVVALIGTGMTVYYRSELVPGDDFYWAPGDYWAILALASTVFALLLAFRITRIENLLNAENYRTFEIVRRVEVLPTALFEGIPGDGKSKLLSAVRRLNQAHSVDSYRNAYYSCRDLLNRIVDSAANISNASCEISNDHGRDDTDDIWEERRDSILDELDYDLRRELADISRDIDSLAYGRQHGHEFSERIALLLIGGMIVVIALAVPVQPSSWARLFAETFSIILGSVVIFLLFHLADLRRSRSDELLIYRETPKEADMLSMGGLFVRFRVERDLSWQRAFAATIIFGVAVALFALLAFDRLGSG